MSQSVEPRNAMFTLKSVMEHIGTRFPVMATSMCAGTGEDDELWDSGRAARAGDPSRRHMHEDFLQCVTKQQDLQITNFPILLLVDVPASHLRKETCW